MLFEGSWLTINPHVECIYCTKHGIQKRSGCYRHTLQAILNEMINPVYQRSLFTLCETQTRFW